MRGRKPIVAGDDDLSGAESEEISKAQLIKGKFQTIKREDKIWLISKVKKRKQQICDIKKHPLLTKKRVESSNAFNKRKNLHRLLFGKMNK